MSSNLWIKFMDYFTNNTNDYLISFKEHIEISLIALLFSTLIGIYSGYVCAQHKKYERWIVSVFQILRIVPSLAILLLLIPIMGTGIKPALIALILLAIPPILMTTVTGLEGVSPFLLEAAYGVGMSERQILWKVKFPLAAPTIVTGIKTAMIEIIASATLAAKIGAGGLGGIIFTGLGLNRMDLLLIGGISVAVLSIAAGLFIGLAERSMFKYKCIRK
ncbi:glycine/betaine ABC transporter permease [Paenibacillus sp. Soil766]|uniref:ABC transporter permease n=1 Tax=Paenibacillus sp. Soil766 TaxID=1736404 RepID=UPI00070B6969|nr:ABC transporter permease [Paenibacillus sp. Soil766]KRF03614.1 glycine/betaine ABC transporter permease [Paenibacillus sp. Soil766]